MNALLINLYVMGLTAKDRITRDENGERGATAVEYGLLVGLIAVAIIVVVTTLGTKLSTLFGGVGSKIPAVTP